MTVLQAISSLLPVGQVVLRPIVRRALERANAYLRSARCFLDVLRDILPENEVMALRMTQSELLADRDILSAFIEDRHLITPSFVDKVESFVSRAKEWQRTLRDIPVMPPYENANIQPSNTPATPRSLDSTTRVQETEQDIIPSPVDSLTSVRPQRIRDSELQDSATFGVFHGVRTLTPTSRRSSVHTAEIVSSNMADDTPVLSSAHSEGMPLLFTSSPFDRRVIAVENQIKCVDGAVKRQKHDTQRDYSNNAIPFSHAPRIDVVPLPQEYGTVHPDEDEPGSSDFLIWLQIVLCNFSDPIFANDFKSQLVDLPPGELTYDEMCWVSDTVRKHSYTLDADEFVHEFARRRQADREARRMVPPTEHPLGSYGFLLSQEPSPPMSLSSVKSDPHLNANPEA
ncbi:unnamed protein product [Somion occarium]|uniref:Uncharacterized protein n=1 Tax=Somion occarium TaxID=3059160 RepID=A0ABP1DE90_9APHY